MSERKTSKYDLFLQYLMSGKEHSVEEWAYMLSTSKNYVRVMLSQMRKAGVNAYQVPSPDKGNIVVFLSKETDSPVEHQRYQDYNEWVSDRRNVDVNTRVTNLLRTLSEAEKHFPKLKAQTKDKIKVLAQKIIQYESEEIERIIDARRASRQLPKA